MKSNVTDVRAATILTCLCVNIVPYFKITAMYHEARNVGIYRLARRQKSWLIGFRK